MLSLEEEAVLPPQHHLPQHSFRRIILQWHTGYFQKHRQAFAILLQIPQGCGDRAIWLDATLVQLFPDILVETAEDRTTVLLMKSKPRLRAHPSRFALEQLTNRRKHRRADLRRAALDLDEAASGVCPATNEDRLSLIDLITTGRISHLLEKTQSRWTMLEQLGDVLAGVASPAHIECDCVGLINTHHPRSLHRTALVLLQMLIFFDQ